MALVQSAAGDVARMCVKRYYRALAPMRLPTASLDRVKKTVAQVRRNGLSMPASGKTPDWDTRRTRLLTRGLNHSARQQRQLER